MLLTGYIRSVGSKIAGDQALSFLFFGIVCTGLITAKIDSCNDPRSIGGVMVRSWRKTWMCLLMLLPASSMCAAVNPDWTTPIAPFRIAENLYYVGSKDLASYLVVTPKGDILINSSLESSPATDSKKRGAAWVSLQGHQDPADQPCAC